MRPRHVVLSLLFGFVAMACAPRRAQEPASPAGAAQESQMTQAQQPGYGTAPPAPTTAAPSSAAVPAEDENGARTEGDFASVAEAEAALEKARAELNPAPPPARPADTEAPAKAEAKKAPAPSAAPAGGLAAGADRCGNACKAFASLKRAAGAVCRLAGESNARCKRAQGIVQENQVRIAVCKCEKNGE